MSEILYWWTHIQKAARRWFIMVFHIWNRITVFSAKRNIRGIHYAAKTTFFSEKDQILTLYFSSFLLKITRTPFTLRSVTIWSSLLRLLLFFFFSNSDCYLVVSFPCDVNHYIRRCLDKKIVTIITLCNLCILIKISVDDI